MLIPPTAQKGGPVAAASGPFRISGEHHTAGEVALKGILHKQPSLLPSGLQTGRAAPVNSQHRLGIVGDFHANFLLRLLDELQHETLCAAVGQNTHLQTRADRARFTLIKGAPGRKGGTCSAA